jgi:BASS family bile acid:Na+ symporter
MLLAFFTRLSVRQTCTIGIEVGMQNSALAMGIALSGLGSEEMAMPAAIYAIVSYATCGLVVLLGRRLVSPEPTPEKIYLPDPAGENQL